MSKSCDLFIIFIKIMKTFNYLGLVKKIIIKLSITFYNFNNFTTFTIFT